jgi:acyl-[acyl-carrier-protein]-phospholipid O-acyltransferase / long-chain-fatty-acid--[acyl-carrier-protein] ligase
MNNIMNALYMVVSALIALGLFAAGWSISELFVLLACLNVSMIVYFGKSNLLFLSNVKQLYQG